MTKSCLSLTCAPITPHSKHDHLGVGWEGLDGGGPQRRVTVTHRHLALLIFVRQIVVDGVSATDGHPFVEGNHGRMS